MYSVFASKEALDKYAVSKEHVEVRDNQVKPHITGEWRCAFLDGANELQTLWPMTSS